jgi:hypothetical protein
MKINQLISQLCALVLLAALPSFAETKDKKVILVPGENLFPLKCETIQGSIDANDKIAPPGSLDDSALRYDSYSFKTDPGNIVFFELSNAKQNDANFNPRLQTIVFNNALNYYKSGFVLGLNPNKIQKEAWYFSRKDTKTTNRNLYISSATYGTYNLRIAYARPSSKISESQIEKAVEDSSILGQRKLMLLTLKIKMGQPLNDDEKIYPVDMNALCKN